MKYKERLGWFFLVGLLLGLVYFLSLNLYQKAPILSEQEHPLPPTLSPEDSLFKTTLEYLNKYYVKNEALKEETLIFGAIKGAFKASGNDYNTFFDDKEYKDFTSDISGQIAGIGVYLQKKEEQTRILALIPKAPAQKSGLKVGDIILSINEIPIDTLPIDEIAKKLQGELYSWVKIDFKRDKKNLSLTIQREVFSLVSVFTKTLPGKIRYLKITDFSSEALEQTKKSLLGIKESTGLILDLRNNPGGNIEVSNEMASFFLPKNSLIVETKGKDPEENQKYYTSQNKELYPLQNPIVVLVNEQSASAAEILAGALKDNKRALLVGQKTFGKGSIQSVFPLPYKEKTVGVKITVAYYLTPNGQYIDHIGLTPDFIVSLPEITLLNQAKIDTIIQKKILEQFLGDNFSLTLTPSIFYQIGQTLAKENLALSPILLKRVIKEQKDIALGNLYTIDWEFDTQMAKAIEIIKKGNDYAH